MHTAPLELAKDPTHPSTYYVAAETHERALLLRVALASSPSSGRFPNALLIGRMRTASGLEGVVNGIPFAATDHKNNDVRRRSCPHGAVNV